MYLRPSEYPEQNGDEYARRERDRKGNYIGSFQLERAAVHDEADEPADEQERARDTGELRADGIDGQ